MVSRIGVGILIIFIGIIVLISGLWDLILDRFFNSIPVVGDLFNLIAPVDIQQILIHILLGFLLIGIGGFLAKSHVRKQGLIS